MTDEDKIAEAAGFLVMELGVDINDDGQRLRLARAIKYADIDNYILNPRNRKDHVRREIFYLKATCYFKRAILTPSIENFQQVDSINKWEYYKLAQLKSEIYPPLMISDKSSEECVATKMPLKTKR